MAKSKSERPAEFPTDWHYEQHLADLERELAGRERRLAELKDMDPQASVLEQAQGELDAVRAELERYGRGQAAASKRPKTQAETR